MRTLRISKDTLCPAFIFTRQLKATCRNSDRVQSLCGYCAYRLAVAFVVLSNGLNLRKFLKERIH